MHGDDPIIGQKYTVSGEDCCLVLQFTATLTDIIYEDWDDTHTAPQLTFDNGVLITEARALRLSKSQEDQPTDANSTAHPISQQVQAPTAPSPT